MANRGRRGHHRHRRCRFNTDHDVFIRAVITVLLTHCYAATAILYKKGDGSENAQKSFKVEDFLWSGSGNGENETDPATYSDDEVWWEYATRTVVQTTTVISIATSTSTATVYRELRPRLTTTGATISVSRPTSPGVVAKCVETDECDIKPSPTIRVPFETRVSPPLPTITTPSSTLSPRTPDPQYWVITVLKLNASVANTDAVFTVVEVENRLARLYKLAFLRHRERSLGAAESNIDEGDIDDEKKRGQYPKSFIRSLRSSLLRPPRNETITVQVHNVTLENSLLRVLYTVKVSGQAILATTAARHMKFVSDAEMVAEFGFPVLMKAEPYLKLGSFPTRSSHEGVAFAGWKRKHAVFIIAGVILACVIVLLLALLLVAVKKHEHSRNMAAALAGTKTLKMRSTDENDDGKTYKHAITPKKSTAPAITVSTVDRGDAEMGSIRTARVRESNHRSVMVKRAAPPTPRPRSSTSGVRTATTSGVVDSPNSFLSMPSVKDFPTAYLPEPLTDVLNNDSENGGGRVADKTRQKVDRTDRMYSRHSSLEGDDPGVLGPIVWKAYRQQTQRRRPFLHNERPTVTFSDTTEESAEHVHYCCTLDDGRYSQDRDECDEDEKDGASSVVKRTKERFNRLLDEALNLYRDNAATSKVQTEIHVGRDETDDRRPSKIERDVENSVRSNDCKTSSSVEQRHDQGADRSQTRVTRFEEARGAWCSSVPSTPARFNMLRPLSAGPFHRPIVRPEFILADSRLPPDDPAVSVIEAIKREIDKIPDGSESSAPIKRSSLPTSSSTSSPS